MIRKLFGGVLVLGLLFTGLQGCGDDKPETKEDPYPTFDAFCKGIAQAQCAKAVQEACGLTSVSNAQCTGEVSAACQGRTNDVTSSIKSTGNYRKDRAEACIKAVTDVYATAKITKDNHTAIRAACDPVFQGKNTSGFECEVDLDCETGFSCYRADLSTPKGTCEKTNAKVKGDDCSVKGDVCGAGLYCSPTDKICGGRPAATGECSAVKPCLETLACGNIDAASGKGTCVDRKVAQQPCEADAECQSNYCAQLGSKKLCLDTLTMGTGSPICENFDGTP